MYVCLYCSSTVKKEDVLELKEFVSYIEAEDGVAVDKETMLVPLLKLLRNLCAGVPANQSTM